MSTDDHKTQCEFSESVHAAYPMISDPKGEIARGFDVFWPFIKLVRRVTFIIDPEGIVRAVLQHELRIGQHVDGAVAALDRLQKKPGVGSGAELPSPVRR